MTEFIVCIPDCHIPYHNKRALRSVVKFIHEMQPSRVVILGDFLDMLAPARWSRGLAAEYAAGVDAEATIGIEEIARLRDGYDGTVDYIAGNHEARLSDYIHKWAPALAEVTPGVPDLLTLDYFGVEYHTDPIKVGPHTLAIHGNKLSTTHNSAGQSAYKERVRFGKSIVQGHTHRLGVGFDTQDRVRFWMECGWLGEVRKAGYLPFRGVANWQLGFGVLTVSRGFVHPETVPLRPDGSFLFGGKEYGHDR